jgi:hypothetical protein
VHIISLNGFVSGGDRKITFQAKVYCWWKRSKMKCFKAAGNYVKGFVKPSGS